MSIKRLLKGATIYSLSEIIVKSGSIILIPVLTRYLSPDEYGVISYLQVLINILTYVGALGFSGAQSRFYYENTNKRDIGEFIFTINTIPVIIFILLGLPFSIFGILGNWSIGKNSIPFNPYIVVVIWISFLQIIADNIIAYFRIQQKYIFTSILQITKFIAIFVITLILVVVFKKNSLGRLLGILLGTVVFVIIFSFSYFKNAHKTFSFKALKYATSYGFPVVIHRLSTVAHNAIDRIVLDFFVDLRVIGYYSLGFTVGGILNIFVMAFNQAFQPYYFKLLKENKSDGDDNIIKIFKIWLSIITILSMVGILISKQFIIFFAGRMFFEASYLVPWFLLSSYFGSFYYFFSSPLFYFKQTKLLPVITGSSALVNILLNILLIPFFGIKGAVLATIVSHILQSLFAYVIGNKYKKINWPKKNIIVSICLVLICFYVSINYLIRK